MGTGPNRYTPGPIELILKREQWIVGLSIAAATILAWAWLVASSGTHAMPGMAMTLSVWNPDYLGAAFVMWALMMVAMMLPSAAPMILLYARLAGNAGRDGFVPTLVFALTYLAIWTVFSAVAVVAQAVLVSLGSLSASDLKIGDHGLAGAMLILAGIYQLTPLKAACLDRCRSPLSFVMQHWRPGLGGAVRMGLSHGLYCLGCCWMLMALLFIGGVMNLAWIAALAVLVLVEKLAPVALRTAISVALLVSGLLLLLPVSASLGGIRLP